ncbi:MAG: hypothetical protein RSF67_09190, partial [Clostridia bacterium]
KCPIVQAKIVDKFTVIKSMSSKYCISTLCKLVGISRSGYYKWLNLRKKLTDRDIQDNIIKDYILDIHKKYRGTYGRKRI